MPFGQRKKIIEKARSKGKKGKSGSGNNGPDIATGTQVHSFRLFLTFNVRKVST